MNRGPETGSGRASNGDDRSFEQKAVDAWGVVPEWVIALAARADRSGLKGAAAAVGYSTSAVSQVIANKYAQKGGDIARFEAKTSGALLGAMVDCPPLGEIDRKACIDWQEKPRAQTSAHRVRMYRACRSCPNFRGKEQADG